MKRITKRIAFLLASVFAFSVLMTGCADPNHSSVDNPDNNNTAAPVDDTLPPNDCRTGIYMPTGTDAAIPEGAADAAYIKGIDDFAAAVLNAMEQGWTGVLSPLSLQLSLELLANSADAETASGILSSLFHEQSIETVNMNAAKLLRSLKPVSSATTKNGGIKFNIANCIIAGSNDSFKEAFENIAADYYGASVGNLDFTDAESARNAINGWISEQTNGLINDLFDSIDPSTTMAILNTVYFNANWKNTFTAYKTPTTFHGLSGDTQVTMLNNVNEYSYGNFDCGEMVLVPYSGGEYYMAVVLPTEGTAARDAMVQLLGRWDECQNTVCDLTIPSVSLDSNINALKLISEIGLDDIASGDSVFPNLLNGSSVSLSQIRHGAHLNVTEAGTEASAASGILGEKHPPVQMDAKVNLICDRPYAMAIVHAKTGAVVFVSVVNDIDL